MTRVLDLAVTICLLAGATGCTAPERHPADAPDSALLAERQARLQQKLRHPDSAQAGSPLARWELPGALNEISGLVLTRDGRLLAHGDNRGRIFEIDYRRGAVVKEFTVGDPALHGDFEAITVVGDSVVLLESDGVLREFPEGADGKSVGYVTQDTGLGTQCEFEGLAYDPSLKALLLACKKVHAKGLKESLLIYRWPLPLLRDTGHVARGDRKPELPSLAIPLAGVIGSNDWTTLHPSDITIDPFNGNYVLIASQEKALVEITPSGTVVRSRPLPPGHDQPEGVAITRDSILIVADEARGGPAVLTLYRWPR